MASDKTLSLLVRFGLDGAALQSGIKSALASFDKMRAKVGEVAGQVSSAATKMGLAFGATGAAITGTLGAAALSAGEFDKAFGEVRTLISDIPTERLDELQAGADRLAVKMGQDVSTAVKAMYDSISAGVDQAEVLEFLEQAAVGAQAGVTDLSRSVDLGTSVLNAYGMGTEQIGDVMDTTFMAVKLGKTTFDELSAAIGKVAPLASEAEVSYAELSAAIATTTASGINTAESMTGMKATLSSILKPSKQASELAAELGISFNAAALKSKGLAGFLADVGQKVEEAGARGQDTTELMVGLFGSLEAANTVFALAANGGEKFNSNLAAMEERAGAASQAAQVATANVGTMVAQIREGFASLWRSIGGGVNDVLGPLIERARDFVLQVAEWARTNQKAVATFAMIAGAIGVVLTVLGLLFGAVAAVAGIIAALAAVGLPILAGVAAAFLPLIGVVVAAAAVLSAAWRPIWDFLKAEVPPLLDLLKSGVMALWAAAQPIIAQARERILGMAEAVIAWVKTQMPALRATIAAAIQWLATVGVPMAGKAIGVVLDMLGWLGRFFVAVWPDAVQTAKKAWELIVAAWDAGRAIVGLLWDVISGVLDLFLGGDSEAPFDWAKAFIGYMGFLYDVLMSVFRAIEQIITATRVLVNVIKDGSIADFFALLKGDVPDQFLPGGKGGGKGRGGVPALASGGIVSRPTLALVGEAGPEAVIPLAGGKVPVDLGLPSALMAGAGAGAPTINVYQQPGEDPHTLAGRIADVIRTRMGG